MSSTEPKTYQLPLVPLRDMVVFPSIALVLTVLSFNILADAFRDWLDPKSLKS